jgi:nucleotide-binding universal stress UspA family protein
MFERILVAVDGSKHSDAAFGVAMEMMRKFGSRLFILHVFPGTTGPILVVSTSEEDTFKNEARDILKLYEKRINSSDLPNVKMLLSKGDAARRILETAKEESCDLIILGRRGKGAWDDLLLGSVSHKVTNRAECPVLVAG